jgi:starvation-inducible outer membrane lipoprotein
LEIVLGEEEQVGKQGGKVGRYDYNFNVVKMEKLNEEEEKKRFKRKMGSRGGENMT